MSRAYPVPLTVIAELLNCDIATPYRAVERFGLRPWIRAHVRGIMTKGAGHCTELDLEAAIRFNTVGLERRAKFVMARKQHHGGRRLEGEALVQMLELPGDTSGLDFLEVWLAFLQRVADDLIAVSRHAYIEDVPWAVAERRLDRDVAPRPRLLAKPRAALDPCQESEGPVSMLGGYTRVRRILKGLSSPNPAIVAAVGASRDLLRFENAALCDAVDWYEAREGMDLGATSDDDDDLVER